MINFELAKQTHISHYVTKINKKKCTSKKNLIVKCRSGKGCNIASVSHSKMQSRYTLYISRPVTGNNDAENFHIYFFYLAMVNRHVFEYYSCVETRVHAAGRSPRTFPAIPVTKPWLL